MFSIIHRRHTAKPAPLANLGAANVFA